MSPAPTSESKFPYISRQLDEITAWAGTQARAPEAVQRLADALDRYLLNEHRADSRRLAAKATATTNADTLSSQELQALLERAGFGEPSQTEIDAALDAAGESAMRVKLGKTGLAEPPLMLVRGRESITITGRFIWRKLPRYLLRAGYGNMVIGGALLATSWLLFASEATVDADTLSGTGFESVTDHINQTVAGFAWVSLFLGAGWVLVGAWNVFRTYRLRRNGVTAEHTMMQRLAAHQRRIRFAVRHLPEVFRKEEITDPAYRDVAVMFRPAGKAPVVRLFRSVRIADIALLDPRARPHIGIVDRLLMLFGLVVSVAFLLLKLALLSAATLFTFGLAVLIPVVAAGGMARRAWREFRNSIKHHQSSLFEHVHTRRADEGQGAILMFAHMAHEQELKRLLLAWGVLAARHSGARLEEVALEAAAVGGSGPAPFGPATIRTLSSLGCVTAGEDHTWHAVAADEAVARLAAK